MRVVTGKYREIHSNWKISTIIVTLTKTTFCVNFLHEFLCIEKSLVILDEKSETSGCF